MPIRRGLSDILTPRGLHNIGTGFGVGAVPAGGDDITVVGYATNQPGIIGSSGNGSDAFTAPSATSGDFLLWVGVGRGTTGSPPASGTGGQTWTQLQNTNANPRQLNISHAEFNGTWTGSLAGANSVSPGSNFCVVLRATAGSTWNIETLAGPGGVAATSSHSTLTGTPSGAPAIVFSISTKATGSDYTSFTDSAGAFTSIFGADEYWSNLDGSDIAGWIHYQYQDSATASGTVSATSGSFFAYTRTTIAVYRS